MKKTLKLTLIASLLFMLIVAGAAIMAYAIAKITGKPEYESPILLFIIGYTLFDRIFSAVKKLTKEEK